MLHAAAYSYDLPANGRGWGVDQLSELARDANVSLKTATLNDLFKGSATGLDRNLTFSLGNGRPSSTPGQYTRDPILVARFEVLFSI